MEYLDPRARIFLIGFGAFIAILLILIIRYNFRRRKGLAALAKELGFTYDRENTQLLKQFEHFRLFPAGSNQKITNVLRRETGSATVWLLDYSYFMSGRKSSLREYSVCALRSPDLKLPYFHLACQISIPGVDKIESFLAKKKIWPGSHDINFPEDEKFSKKFFLQGQEEAKIRLLFDHDLRHYLLRFARQFVKIEGNCDTLLFTTGEPVLPEAAREVIQQTTGLFTLFSQRKVSLEEDLSGTKAKDGSPKKDLSERTGEAKKGRGSSITFKRIMFLIGSILAIVGGVIIFTEIQGALKGLTEPLGRKLIIGLFVLIIGLGIVLQIMVGPTLKRRSIKRQLKDMSDIEGSGK